MNTSELETMERLERQRDEALAARWETIAERDEALKKLWSFGLLSTHYDTLAKAVDGIGGMIEVLRRPKHLEPDVQEAVMAHLNLIHRDAVKPLVDALEYLSAECDDEPHASAAKKALAHAKQLGL